MTVGRLLVRRDPRLRLTGYYGLVVTGAAGRDRGEWTCQVSSHLVIQNRVDRNVEPK